MHTQIDTAISGQCRPKENRPPEKLIAEKQRQQSSESKRVRRVAGDKAVFPAPIIEHHFHLIHKIRMMRGAETSEYRLAHMRRELVAQGNRKRDHQQNQQRLFPVLPIA